MQEFYAIAGREQLYIYVKDGTKYERQYIKGEPVFRYQLHQAKNDMKELSKALMEEYNLDSDAKGNQSEITFLLIESVVPVITEAVCNGLEGYLSRRYPLDKIVSDAMKKLEAADMPLLKEFGVNFDGVNYRWRNSSIQKADFSLLAYTLQADDLIQCVR